MASKALKLIAGFLRPQCNKPTLCWTFLLFSAERLSVLRLRVKTAKQSYIDDDRSARPDNVRIHPWLGLSQICRFFAYHAFRSARKKSLEFCFFVSKKSTILLFCFPNYAFLKSSTVCRECKTL